MQVFEKFGLNAHQEKFEFLTHFGLFNQWGFLTHKILNAKKWVKRTLFVG